MQKKWRHTKPYSQQFKYIVPKEYAGQTLLDFYEKRFSFRSKEYWQELITKGCVSINNQGVDFGEILKENDVILTRRDDVTEPDVNIDFQVLYDEQGVFIINKPAPLPVHPAGRYYKNSLIYILKEENPERQLHTIHRLDTWTTGVLILATEKEKARFLHQQVENKEIKKSYAVLAKGDFGDKPFIVDEAVGRVDGAHRGTGLIITEAKKSKTEFIPLAKNKEVTLLKAVPITGRTNQIRVHVQAKGGYILNDPLYSPKGNENASFMGLHCYSMGFKLSPNDEKTFIAPWPEEFYDFFSKDELGKLFM